MSADGTHCVLAVEDEELLLQSMSAALSTLPEVEVWAAQTVGEALELLERVAPDLLLTDLSLPDGTGLQIIEKIESRNLRIPVIIQTGQLSQFRDAIPEHPRLIVLEKPISMKELRNQVAVQLGGEQRGQQVDPFGVVDYLQLAGFSRRSLLLVVRLEDGRSGHIAIVDGDAWQAQVGEHSGVEAISAMVAGPVAAIEVDELHAEPGTREIVVPTQGLLLELARLEDEARHRGDAGGGFSAFALDPFASGSFPVVDLSDDDEPELEAKPKSKPKLQARSRPSSAARARELLHALAGGRLDDARAQLDRLAPEQASRAWLEGLRITDEPEVADGSVALCGFDEERGVALIERLDARGVQARVTDLETLLADGRRPSLLVLAVDGDDDARPFARLELLWALQLAGLAGPWLVVAEQPTRYSEALCARLGALSWIPEEPGEADDERLAAELAAWMTEPSRTHGDADVSALGLVAMLANLGVDAGLELRDEAGRRGRLQLLDGELHSASLRTGPSQPVLEGVDAGREIFAWTGGHIDVLAPDPGRERNLPRGLPIALAALLRGLPGVMNLPSRAAQEQEQAMSSVNTVCEQVVDDVQDALACGVVDLNTGMLMGVHHTVAYFTQSYLDAVAAAAVDMFRGKNVRRVEKMISKHRGKEIVDAFEEIFISSPGVFHFMKLIREKSAVVVLVTRKTTNQGMGWASLRMAVDDIAEALP